jgi:hypothetical protein
VTPGRLRVRVGSFARGRVAIALLVFGVTATGAAADAIPPHVDVPLVRTAIALRDGAMRRVVVRGRWEVDGAERLQPGTYGALLRIVGGAEEGDSGVIVLPASRWQRRGAVLRYRDREATAGGVRLVRLQTRRRGGVLEIRGGSRHWSYGLTRPQTRVDVTLELDGTWICGGLAGTTLRQRAGHLSGSSRTAPSSCPCARTFDGTWNAIQQLVFDRHACRLPTCHGSAPGSGGLDLEAGRAYRNLIGVPSTDAPALRRVDPGSPQTSMLWLKLAARTLGLEGVPLSPMPIVDPPLSVEELDAVARWIAAGAPETGVVAGTAEGLDACLEGP